MKKRNFSAEFKRESAQLVVDQNYTVADAAKAMDVGLSTMTRWVKQLRDERQGKTPKASPITPEQIEIRELRKKLQRIEMENEILKKATVDSIGQRNSYVKTWGCGGFLNETNIYSRGKSLCQGYFDYTSQHHVIMWRWLIATAFINEMRKENGTVSIIDDSGNHSVVSVYSNGIVAMPLYPVAERLAMANNIEGAMIEKYGVDVGTKNAIIFYSNMFDVEQGTLTSFGREVLADLHNSFIAELNENGIPEAPVTH